jgi:hypothetical protein
MRHAVSAAGANHVQRDPQTPARLGDRFNVRSPTGIIAEHRRAGRRRRERLAKAKTAGIDGIVNHADARLRDARAHQPLAAVEVHRHIANNTRKQRRRVVPGLAIMTHKNSARAGKRQQRPYGFHVMMAVDDLGRLGNVARVCHHGHPRAFDLPGDFPDLRAEHRRRMSGCRECPSQVVECGFGAGSGRKLEVCQENTHPAAP